MKNRSLLIFWLIGILVITTLITACGANTVESQTGTITGRLCYPSEVLPPMNIYARDVESQETYSVHTDDTKIYTLEVPGGRDYQVFAWALLGDPPTEQQGGVYSCLGEYYGIMAYQLGGEENLSCEDPEDQTLLNVHVDENETVDGIHICDFYLPKEEVPKP